MHEAPGLWTDMLELGSNPKRSSVWALKVIECETDFVEKTKQKANSTFTSYMQTENINNKNT